MRCQSEKTWIRFRLFIGPEKKYYKLRPINISRSKGEHVNFVFISSWLIGSRPSVPLNWIRCGRCGLCSTHELSSNIFEYQPYNAITMTTIIKSLAAYAPCSLKLCPAHRTWNSALDKSNDNICPPNANANKMQYTNRMSLVYLLQFVFPIHIIPRFCFRLSPSPITSNDPWKSLVIPIWKYFLSAFASCGRKSSTVQTKHTVRRQFKWK